MSDNKEETSTAPADKTIEEVLDELKVDLLTEFLEGNSVKVKKSQSSKKKLVQQIMETAEKKGEQIFLNALDKEAMKNALHVIEKTDDLGHDSKVKMQKAFKDHIHELGHDKFFEKMSGDVLDQFCESLSFKEEGEKEEKIDALCEEITVSGLRKMFEVMAGDFIKDVVKALELPTSGSRAKLIDRILAEGYPHLKEAAAKEEKTKKTKKGEKGAKGEYKNAPDVADIKKGIDFSGLYQYYTGQLQEWLKEKELKTSGSKKELCKRIEGYLNGDEKAIKEAQKMKPGERRKRKRGPTGGGRKKKSAEESEDKDEEESDEPAKKKQKK